MSLLDHIPPIQYWDSVIPQSERIVEFEVAGQTVTEGNIFPADLTIDSWVTCGFDRNFSKHLQHCHITIPKQHRNTNVRKNCLIQEHLFCECILNWGNEYVFEYAQWWLLIKTLIFYYLGIYPELCMPI